MDFKYIEQLLERYWQCETSLEEEAQLRTFFTEEAVVLSLGNVMQHSFFADVREVAAADTIGKQISAPSVALSGDRAATHEKQILDSLHRVSKEKENRQ